MKKLLLLGFLLPLMLLSFEACAGNKKVMKGNKDIVKKEFAISAYDKIALSSFHNIVYEQTDTPTGYVTVEADENVMPYVEVKVVDKELRIRLNEKDSKPSKFVVYANSADLKKISLSGAGNFKAGKKVKLNNLNISLSGAGNINFDDLEVETIDCGLSGAGNISLVGKADRADFRVSGAGNVKAEELVAQHAKCRVSGVGNINVKALDKLEASVSGVGNINYRGEPKELKKSQSGMGKVRKRD